MVTINDFKEMGVPETPILLIDCTLPSGDVQRWSTHTVTANGNAYAARVLKHNLFDLQFASNEGTGGPSKLSLTLANADSFLSSIERTVGWKGSRATATFLFYDLINNVVASDTQVVFQGVANPPDESTESQLRLSFINRFNLQQMFLPDTRIQKRCPWSFPGTAEQRAEAVSGGSSGPFSTFYRCGYSADQTNGVGTLNNGMAFDSCDYSRTQCQARGMFATDANGNVTQRFGGIEFVPSSILVRSYGEKGSSLSSTVVNQAAYNDVVPLVYGTGWYLPPIVFARNDGNLTHMEVLLGAGPITSVIKVIVNSIEVPAGVAGANMTATGWYNVVTLGSRNGAFNMDFTDGSGNPLGDPYGSMACLSVVVPNNISDGSSLPSVEVLIEGLQVSTFDSTGSYVDDEFTNNPAWVLLDALRRSGWSLDEIDLTSFGSVAQICAQPVPSVDLNGNPILIPRYQCNLMLLRRRSAGDIVRGIRTGSALYLVYNSAGLLQLRSEDTLANQQPTLPPGSNSTAGLDGGWPAYEFGDNKFSGILRSPNGQASFRTWSRSSADTPNFFTVEFQDEFNEYQQDSFSLDDVDDTLLVGQQITTTLTALGIPNFDQANRIIWLQLNKSVYGNTYVDFETSVKAVSLRPGDLITISYSKEGWNRQPFRVIRMSPGPNFRTVSLTAQIHDDSWYSTANEGSPNSGRQAAFQVGLPLPLLGTLVDSNGNSQFGIAESSVQSNDGTIAEDLAASFIAPSSNVDPALGVPLAGLNPQISTTGGTLPGDRIVYYGITATDASGAEGPMSFVIKAEIPAGTNTNQVTLGRLSFSSTAAGFNVYRGATPQELLRIATQAPIAATFSDTGAAVQQIGPPDINYDHANFYWRMELQPESGVDIFSAATIGNSTLQMLANELTGATVRITGGTGEGQEGIITANTATTLTISIGWSIQPDATSLFVVSDSSWQFGATGATSPVSFEVPNRAGITVQISGRSANVQDQECAYALSPLTRWRIAGAGGSSVDTGVPPAPIFGLDLAGEGTVEVAGIGFFNSLNNTATIAAGTLTFGYWDELSTSALLPLGTDVDSAATSLILSAEASFAQGDLIQIDSEVMVVQNLSADGITAQVTRGAYNSVAAAHTGHPPVYPLDKKMFVMPFSRDLFGSPASGSYAYPVFLPDVRIATAELFMTNGWGNSEVTRNSYTSTVDGGLRTLSGGQVTIQVEGPLAIQTNVAPPISVDDSHAVRDVFAVLKTPSTGGPIQLQVTQGGNPYCQLTIPESATISNVVDGFQLGPLQANALIGLDILSVTQGSDTVPGSDLTVSIRM